MTAAESENFEVLLTTDKNIRHQQNPDGRRLAIVVLPTTDWRKIRMHTDVVAQALETLAPGGYMELSFPR